MSEYFEGTPPGNGGTCGSARNMKTPASQLARSLKVIEKLKAELVAAIEALPDNAVAPPMPGSARACIARSSDLNDLGGWSAEYHLFRTQYEAFQHLITLSRPETLMARLKTACLEGEIQERAGRDGRLRLHPEVCQRVWGVVFPDVPFPNQKEESEELE
jgi:hypothetical protein